MIKVNHILRDDNFFYKVIQDLGNGNYKAINLDTGLPVIFNAGSVNSYGGLKLKNKDQK